MIRGGGVASSQWVVRGGRVVSLNKHCEQFCRSIDSVVVGQHCYLVLK